MLLIDTDEEEGVDQAWGLQVPSRPWASSAPASSLASTPGSPQSSWRSACTRKGEPSAPCWIQPCVLPRTAVSCFIVSEKMKQHVYMLLEGQKTFCWGKVLIGISNGT